MRKFPGSNAPESISVDMRAKEKGTSLEGSVSEFKFHEGRSIRTSCECPAKIAVFCHKRKFSRENRNLATRITRGKNSDSQTATLIVEAQN